MDFLSREDLNTLLKVPRTHCVSIYLPTHRGGAEQDRIRWRVHLDEAEDRLAATGLRAPDARGLVLPARQLLDEPLFWQHQSDGLACFIAPELLRLFRVPMKVPDMTFVSRRFHVAPLLPLLIGNGRFHVLALSQNAVRLLDGTRDAVSEVDLTGVPRNLAEALLSHDRDEPLNYHTRPAGGIGSWAAIFSGQGIGIDDKKDGILRYFQRIDRGIYPLLHSDEAPLILAAVEYLMAIYRKANTYPHLLGEGIEGNPDQLSSQQLHDRAWLLVKPRFERARETATAQYRQLSGTGRTASSLEEIISASHRGEVTTLFVTAPAQRWGRYDETTGRLEVHDQPQSGDEDLVNLAAAYTLLHGHTVYAVEADQMPDATPLAAIFHVPLAKHRKGA